METQTNFFIPHFLLIIAALLLLEYVFQLSWTEKKYKNGPTCFFLKIKCKKGAVDFTVDNLKTKFMGALHIGAFGKGLIPAILFKQVDEKTILFQEEATFPMVYQPSLRGIIEYNSGSEELIYSWKIKYYPILLYFLIGPLVIYAMGAKDFGFLVLFPIYLCISFVFQYVRYFFIMLKSKTELNYKNQQL